MGSKFKGPESETAIPVMLLVKPRASLADSVTFQRPAFSLTSALISFPCGHVHSCF